MLGCVVGVPAGFWFGRAGGNDEVRPDEAQAASHVEIAGTTAPALREPNGMRVPFQSDDEARIVEAAKSATGDSKHDPTELHERLQALLEDRTGNKRKIERLLRDLVATGDRAGLDLALQLMGDRSLDSHSTFWSQLFAETDDPRIGSIAREVLDANLSQSLTSWVHTKGYVQLMAMKGGADEAAALVEMLAAKSVSLSPEVIGSLAGKVSPGSVLDILAEGTNRFVTDIAEGLAGWKDPDVTKQMWELATEPGISDSSREAAFRGLAFHTSVDSVDDYLFRYWYLRDAAERSAFLGSLGYVARVDGGLPSESLPSVRAVVENGLSAPTFQERSAALYCVEYNDALHTHFMLQRLRTMEAASTEPNELERVKQTVGRVQFTLR